MKTINKLLFFGLFAISSFSYADGLSVKVDRSTVGVDENIVLTIELSDAQASTSPNLSGLKNKFQIVSQQQSSQMKIMNGQSSASTIWRFTIVPTQPGQMTIPPIKVATDHGLLETQPISIQVNQEAPSTSKAVVERGISFLAKLNKIEVYKNEPVLLTVKLTSNRSLRNIQLGNLNMKDAIVEAQGQPKTYAETVNGHQQQVLTVSYVVTPLKEGVLTVPSLIVRGETLAPLSSAQNSAGNMNSIFDNDNDEPFVGMQKMMQSFTQNMNMFDGFSKLKPITLSTKTISIKVLPAVAGMNPWLPTTSLKLTESWSSDKPRVGNPLTRTITTEAAGLSASQLPGFEDQLQTNSEFKVYSDRPETSTTMSQGQINSTRKDIFTIIPQISGQIRYPALKLIWWDTHSRTQQIASLPERVVIVLDEPTNLTPPNLTKSNILQPDQATTSVSKLDSLKPSKEILKYGFYVIFAMLGLFLAREYFLGKKIKPPPPPLL